MGDIKAIANENDLFILEDCAQAHGSEWKGRRVGSIGHAGTFSFFATKHMTTGEGGIITSDDEKLATTCRSLRSHGMVDRDTHQLLGYNNRMTEMEAAMGLVQLAKLDHLNKIRIKNSEFLLEKLRLLGWAQVPDFNVAVKHTYFWCPLMVRPESGKTVEELNEHLNANGIGFRHRYGEPLYKQPVLQQVNSKFSDLKLPVVERVAGNVIGLPNHPGMMESELNRVIQTLRNF